MEPNDKTNDELNVEPKPARRGRPRKTEVIPVEDPLAFLDDPPAEIIVETPQPRQRKSRSKPVEEPVSEPAVELVAAVDVPEVIEKVAVSLPVIGLAEVPVETPKVIPARVSEAPEKFNYSRRRARIKAHLKNYKNI